MNIDKFIETSTKSEILNKLLELKIQPQTEDVKLLIQKLQQTLR